MNNEQEVPPGGSQVYRYKDQNRKWQAPAAYGTYAEEICAHFENLFPGRESIVYHEIISDLVHIDVNVMKPNLETRKENGGYYVVFTTGMSDLPMTLPEQIADREDLKYAELFLFLPESWAAGGAGTISTQLPWETRWAIEAIKFLARLPHEHHGWLGWGHTIPNGADYEPILEGSDMGGFVLLELGEDFSPVKAHDGRKIRLYMVTPATRAEIEYKLEHGMAALDDLFEEHDLPVVIDLFRKSVI